MRHLPRRCWRAITIRGAPIRQRPFVNSICRLGRRARSRTRHDLFVPPSFVTPCKQAVPAKKEGPRTEPRSRAHCLLLLHSEACTCCTQPAAARTHSAAYIACTLHSTGHQEGAMCGGFVAVYFACAVRWRLCAAFYFWPVIWCAPTTPQSGGRCRGRKQYTTRHTRALTSTRCC